MDPLLFFVYSALIGLSIPATAAIIASITTFVERTRGKTTPTILTGKLQDSSDGTADIPNQVLPYLKTTNSPFTCTKTPSKKSSNTLSEYLKKKFPTSGINVSTPNHDSSSHTPINYDKEK